MPLDSAACCEPKTENMDNSRLAQEGRECCYQGSSCCGPRRTDNSSASQDQFLTFSPLKEYGGQPNSGSVGNAPGQFRLSSGLNTLPMLGMPYLWSPGSILGGYLGASLGRSLGGTGVISSLFGSILGSRILRR
jgi:hypothetical protein